ncbi:methylglyoxal reductase (NADPH-dependent) gre2 [Saitozyma podzolica]|uniref:Methylglyoxal reductase (NADPH-dependent) gre2 n=1 Tax=Saitozyma podzolica TaxID=1890683 RepID=A0A427YC44_9TREE|nr:methylglyoxal reductase (NADPH-dependent) gre2 [Saitozyma podzolica]
MPAIKPGSLVLVTGASGFIAAHAVGAFLDEGYPVRGTVRSQDKGEYLAKLFAGKKAKFEYAIVKDIAEDGAFDEAVKGVDAVAHMASPYHFEADEPDELFVPAVNGTVGVLNSLKKNNPNISRIVITSSVAAVINSDIKPPHHFDEKDWNTISIPACEKLGRGATGVDKYRASKTLAEKAFWKWIEDNKPSFDGVTVLGPIIHQVDSPDSLNTSVANFYSWMTGKHKQEELPAQGGNWIDVRDCALAHVRALEVPDATGRFICSNGPFSGNDFCLTLNRLYPDLPNIPKGDASQRDKLISEAYFFDGGKCAKVLGIKYTPLEKCLGDMARCLKEKFGP